MRRARKEGSSQLPAITMPGWSIHSGRSRAGAVGHSKHPRPLRTIEPFARCSLFFLPAYQGIPRPFCTPVMVNMAGRRQSSPLTKASNLAVQSSKPGAGIMDPTAVWSGGTARTYCDYREGNAHDQGDCLWIGHDSAALRRVSQHDSQPINTRHPYTNDCWTKTGVPLLHHGRPMVQCRGGRVKSVWARKTISYRN